jgi:hypothetical protein
LFSAAAASLTTCNISYDVDVDPRKRNANPGVYGYVGDQASKRFGIFAAMFTQSMLLMLTKSTGVAVLILLDPRLYMTVFGLELVALYVFKALMGDFKHWVPAYGLRGFLSSLLLKANAKIIVEFTACWYFRHPLELGGVTWSITILWSFVGPILVWWVTCEDAEAEIEIGTLVEALVPSAGAAFLCSFAFAVILMKPKYRKSLVDATTGARIVQDIFLKGGDDRAKSRIMRTNHEMWRPVRRDVGEWVHNSYFEWEDEMPDWMTEEWLSLVPDDFFPVEVVLARSKEKGVGGGGGKVVGLLHELVVEGVDGARGGGRGERRGETRPAIHADIYGLKL